jgi:hypothetical protein
LGLVVAFLVVTITRMTASNEYTVGAVQQRLEDIHRVYRAATHQAYHPHVGWILDAHSPRQVRADVSAPIA